MIKFIKSWCEGIIVGVILSVIIELIMPEGSNKKYLKVISGIYIIFIILNPIFQKLNFDFSSTSNFEFEESFNDILNENYVETSANEYEFNNEIKDVYILGLEESIKEFLEKSGYKVEKVSAKVDLNYEEIETLEIKIADSKNINDENNKNNETNKNIEKVKIEEIVISKIEKEVDESDNVSKEEHLENIETEESKKIKEMIFEEYEIEQNKINVYR